MNMIWLYLDKNKNTVSSIGPMKVHRINVDTDRQLERLVEQKECLIQVIVRDGNIRYFYDGNGNYYAIASPYAPKALTDEFTYLVGASRHCNIGNGSLITKTSGSYMLSLFTQLDFIKAKEAYQLALPYLRAGKANFRLVKLFK